MKLEVEVRYGAQNHAACVILTHHAASVRDLANIECSTVWSVLETIPASSWSLRSF